MSRYRRILVAIDGSETSNKALDEAIALARDGGACIRIVHVYDEGSHEHPREDTHFMRDTARGYAQKILEHGVEHAKTNEVDADSLLAEADGRGLGETVADEASRWSADLIVTGTHGRRGISRALLGSGAEQIVRHAPVAALVIRSAG